VECPHESPSDVPLREQTQRYPTGRMERSRHDGPHVTRHPCMRTSTTASVPISLSSGCGRQAGVGPDPGCLARCIRYLGYNELSGTLPREWSALSDMVALYVPRILRATSPSPSLGERPEPTRAHSEHLWALNADADQFLAARPMPICRDLAYNSLSGEAPPEWSSLTSLDSL